MESGTGQQILDLEVFFLAGLGRREQAHGLVGDCGFAFQLQLSQHHLAPRLPERPISPLVV